MTRAVGLMFMLGLQATLSAAAQCYRSVRSVLSALLCVVPITVAMFAVSPPAMSWYPRCDALPPPAFPGQEQPCIPAPKDPDIYTTDIGSCEADGTNVNYSFAIITDTHVGYGVYDYGYRGVHGVHDYVEELPFGFPDSGTRNLYNAVEWIKSHVDSERIQIHNGQWLTINGIKFVAELGDLTESGEPSEQGVGMTILDQLPVPWLPVVGNHDLLPYSNWGSWFPDISNIDFHLNDKASAMKTRGPCTFSLYEAADYEGLALTFLGPNDHDAPFLGAGPYGAFDNIASSIKIEACGGGEGLVALYDEKDFGKVTVPGNTHGGVEERSQYTLFKESDSNFSVIYQNPNLDFDSIAYTYYKQKAERLKNESGVTGFEITPPESNADTIRYFLNYAFDYAPRGSAPMQFVVLDFSSRTPVPTSVGFGTYGQGDLFMDYPNGPYNFLAKQLPDPSDPDKRPTPTVILAHYMLSKSKVLSYTYFDPDEYSVLADLLAPSRPYLAAWFGGHGHRNWDETVKTSDGNEDLIRTVETGANYEHIAIWGSPAVVDGLVRVVRVCQKLLVDPGSADLWIDNFGYDQDWRVEKHSRVMADVDGDGKADVVGFGDAGVGVALSTGSGFDNTSTPQPWIENFGYDQGWRVENHPRLMADVDGDGKADVVGFGEHGVGVALSTGSAFDNASTPQPWVGEFGAGDDAGSWRVEEHLRLMADVNGDGKADVVGFKNDGVWVSLSTGLSLTAPQLWIANFGSDQGWLLDNHPRMMADVNGDGKADVVGFGDAGVGVALSTGSAFDNASTPQPWIDEFGYGDDAGSWRVGNHPRMMADVNGDGMADVVGFGDAGVGVALSTGSAFDNASTPQPWNEQFGYGDEAGSWRVERHPRIMADMDGDGQLDVVGFGNEGVGVGISTGFHFDNRLWTDSFGYDDFWRINDHPRMMADVNGDGKDDTIGFGDAGVYVILSDILRPVNITVTDTSITVDEGQTAQNGGKVISDPAGAPVTVVASVGTVDYSGDTWSWSFATSDGPAESQTVTITASDASGTDAVNFELVVNNIPPVASVAGDESGLEGTMVALVGSAVDAPGDAGTITLGWSVTKNGNAFASGTGPGITFTPDDNGTYQVALTATDKDGGSGSASHTVLVENVAPTVGPIDGPGEPAVVGTEIAVEGSFVDPGGLDTHTAVWTWGDGTVTDPASLNQGAGSGAVIGSHSYLASGEYTIRLSVTDNDNGEGFSEFAVSVQSPSEATSALIEQVEAMAYLEEGIAQALVSQLNGAVADLERGRTSAALGKLNAFIRTVEAQRGKAVTDEDAEALIQTAQEIIDAIENGLS